MITRATVLTTPIGVAITPIGVAIAPIGVPITPIRTVNTPMWRVNTRICVVNTLMWVVITLYMRLNRKIEALRHPNEMRNVAGEWRVARAAARCALKLHKQEQLGLRLEATKASFEVTVIASAEHRTDD